MQTKQAILIFRTRARMAKWLCISRSAVSQWGDVVPELQVYKINELVARHGEVVLRHGEPPTTKQQDYAQSASA